MNAFFCESAYILGVTIPCGCINKCIELFKCPIRTRPGIAGVTKLFGDWRRGGEVNQWMKCTTSEAHVL